MASNYDDGISKQEAVNNLLDSTLSFSTAQQIIKSLGGGKVTVGEFGNTSSSSDLAGHKLALFTGTGGTATVNFSGAGKNDLKGVKSIVFGDNSDVTFTLTGDGAKKFKGTISTNDGDDNLTVQDTKKVFISTGDGNDSVTTGDGKDTVATGDGNDNIKTNGGNDLVFLGDGSDSAGSDTVDTGAGNDIVKLVGKFVGTAVVDGGAGNDKLDLSAVDIADVTVAGTSVSITLQNGGVINASNFEKFVFDSNGTLSNGGIKTVGLTQLDDFFNPGS
ncbi:MULTISPECIES: calcium-binding protein [Methylomonas]|uniref:calcium-binding protein n=1 Tax=Methylomonas TaxID=416 RepID=UPI001232178C|nr:hypothetical protein [Methylomonas rhizoryzae]